MAQLTCRRGPPCNYPELAWLPASAETDTGGAAERALLNGRRPGQKPPGLVSGNRLTEGLDSWCQRAQPPAAEALRAASEGPGGAAGPARPWQAGEGTGPCLCSVLSLQGRPPAPISGVSTWGRSSRPISHGAADCDTQSGLKSTDSVFM